MNDKLVGCGPSKVYATERCVVVNDLPKVQKLKDDYYNKAMDGYLMREVEHARYVQEEKDRAEKERLAKERKEQKRILKEMKRSQILKTLTQEQKEGLGL